MRISLRSVRQLAALAWVEFILLATPAEEAKCQPSGHRIIESLRLEKTSKIIKSNH